MVLFEESLNLIGVLILILLFVLGSTYIIRRFHGVEAHVVYSLWRSKKLLKVFERLRFLAPIVNTISILGAIFGFGILASDFLFMKKQSLPKRLICASIVAVFLEVFYFFTLRPIVIGAKFTQQYDVILGSAFSVFGVSSFGLLLMLFNGFHILKGIFTGSTVCPGVAPLIPGVKIPKVPVFIPWYGWIALLVAMILHEGAHGIQALKEKFSLKSAGVLLVGVLPIGAFVEPDEDRLKNSKPDKRILTYAAGPSANLFSIPFFVIIALLFNSHFVAPVYERYYKSYLESVAYVEITNVPETIPYCNNPSSPAYGILRPGMRILAVDGNLIKNRVELYNILNTNRLKERNFTIIDDNKEMTVTIYPNQELPLSPPENFGFTVRDVLKESAQIDNEAKAALTGLYLIESLLWLCFLLSFLIMIFNFLPIIPLDGGYIASDIYSYYFLGEINEKNKKIISDLFLIFFFIVAVLNIVPFFI
ncbi:MAG: M50 family metallopeptidase [Candidatus Diapherotrites archaeon]